MPSLVGYTRDEAAALLAARGLATEFRKEYSCELPRGYAIGTIPAAGASVRPGDRVQVRVIAGILPSARCFTPLQGVWDLVRFARGLGPAPDFPGGVAIAVGTVSP